MPADDLLYVLVWWMVLLVLTFVNYPLTARLFSLFVDRGYIFAKILGILLLSYIVYVLGSLRIAPFTFTTILSVLLLFILINTTIVLKNLARAGNFKNSKSQKLTLRSFTSYFSLFTSQIKLAVIEEFLFLLVLLAWSYVRAHQPAIEGLEKLMDYGFVKSILNSHFFPPRDMWLAPAPLSTEFKPEVTSMLQGFYINYYYFGHLVAAVLTRLSQLPPAITYNLQLATLAALTFAGSFSLGINLIRQQKEEIGDDKISDERLSEVSPPPKGWLRGIRRSVNNFLTRNTSGRSRRTSGDEFAQRKFSSPRALLDKKLVFAGLLTAFLVTFSGNLHTIYSFTHGYQTKNNEFPPPPWNLQFDTVLTDYWYPNATRFIPYTIHEFPSYSSIVADLHGHFSNIPFVLLMLAVLLNLLQRSEKWEMGSAKRKWEIGFFDILKSQKVSPQYQKLRTSHFALLILIGFLLAIFYMTNSWDTLVYGLLALAIILYTTWHICRKTTSDRGSIFYKNLLVKSTGSIAIIGIVFLLFSLPFSYFFHPFSSKIGVNCGYGILDSIGIARFFQKTPASIAYSDLPAEPKTISIGPLLFEPNNCQKTPLWMHLVLWGFFYYTIAGFAIFIAWPKFKRRRKNKLRPPHSNTRVSSIQYPVSATDTFIILMILVSLFLLWVPEFFYIKDIYPAHFRANTMFKLGYQAFIMLSIASGYTIIKLFQKTQKNSDSQSFSNSVIQYLSIPVHLYRRLTDILKNRFTDSPIHRQFNTLKFSELFRKIYLALLIPQLFLVGIYSLFGINSYYNGLRNYRGLYGLNWLRERHPDDYNGVLWLDKQAQTLCIPLQPTSHFSPQTTGTKCPVVLEAVGDSYTEYARVSANTGLPTVLGWPVHEWLWRGSYDEAGKRKGEVETIYTSQNTRQVKDLLTKYGVEYIFVGELEREKYPKLTEEIFRSLGTIVYQSGDTRIYKLYN